MSDEAEAAGTAKGTAQASSSSKVETRAGPSLWKRVGMTVAVLLALLLLILLVRTFTFTSRQPAVSKAQLDLPDQSAMAKRLAGALRIQTVSYDEDIEHAEPSSSGAAFDELHDYLRAQFPLVHDRLQRESVGQHSALFTWSGRDPGRPPLLLLGHLDVVPADATRWTHAPFSGRVADGYVWGRGAIDDKLVSVALLEATEQLLRKGFEPEQTIYIALGHDEEIGGYTGAHAIAALLAERGVHAEAVIDEGLAITEGILEGIDVPVALIGIAEKGFLNVELIATGEGGHSSMPPRQTAVGILSAAIARLQEHPMPGAIDGAVK
jgi:carboxypeptidase PM20D1